MKKTLIAVAILFVALGSLGVVIAEAQGSNPPFGQRGVADGTGPMHEYMEKAMAEALGLSVNEFEVRHNAGETFYQIALAEGFTAEEIPALMQDARAKALDAAAKDGVISQERADWMKSHGFGRGGMYGNYGYGGCPMYDSQDAGAGFGRGRMHDWTGQYQD